MKSLETFIIERSTKHVYSYNSPDEIHLDDDLWGEMLNWTSTYARAFIYSTKLDDFLFSSEGNNHISIMYDKNEDAIKNFDDLYDIAYNQNGIDDLRFITDNNDYNNDYKEWKKFNPYFKRFKLGRIWSYDDILYITWWDELTPTQFIKYNKSLINYINAHLSELDLDTFDTIYYMSNSGKLIEYDPNKVVSTRSTKNRKEIIKAQQAIHLATQKEKQKFFKEFIKNRDENNQKKHYNHTKSKTEAEWRSIRYQGDSLIDTEKNRIIE